MRLIVADDYKTMSRIAARLIAEAIKAQPAASIVVPTGATPEGFYRELAALHRQGEFEASCLHVFQLDEYLGVSQADPRSFYGWIKRDLLDPLGIPETNVVRLRGDAADIEEACRQYDARVQELGGFDVAVLGLGHNGHLGFNEPPADPRSATHVVDLSEDTIRYNACYWNGSLRVPRQALTCGMANLLAARQVIVLVSGEHKRDILLRTLTGPVTPAIPSSYLQQRAHVTCVADRAAWPRGLSGEHSI